MYSITLRQRDWETERQTINDSSRCLHVWWFDKQSNRKMRGECICLFLTYTCTVSRWSANLFFSSISLFIRQQFNMLCVRSEYAIFHIKQFDSDYIWYLYHLLCCLQKKYTHVFMWCVCLYFVLHCIIWSTDENHVALHGSYK